MSWGLASLAIVLGVLIAGWLSYERSQPSARTIAVVGTLAALAALGRDAFAALPDVKPITAMTLVVGYALGPLSGFAVGAIGMLASNVLLGEGPYTPWQMAAWGMVGLAGAAIGALSGRRLPRVGIALACALSALAAKEVMNVYEWTLGASHTSAALLLTAAKGLPFDVTDTVASFLFGLAFGPELARLLSRVRARMTVTWEPLVALMLLAPLAPLALLAAPDGARADGARADVSRPLAYLERAQNRDGGFGSEPGARSSELYSAWAALGLAAAGRDPAHVTRDGRSVLDAIRAQAGTLQSAGDLERTILALHAAGAPARLTGGGNLSERLLAHRSADGSFDRLVNITSFAVLALRAAGRPPDDPLVQSAAAWLAAQQQASGGFSYAGRGGVADVDDTAAAVQALAAAGRTGSAAVERSIGFLLRARNGDGGFPQQPGGESNAQSTAWAVQALVAAGRDPARTPRATTRTPRGTARSPIAYLRGLIASDGSVRYSRAVVQTPVWVTAQALAALARQPLPIGRPREPANSARAAPAWAPRALPSPASQAARRAGRLARAGQSATSPAGLHGGKALVAARARMLLPELDALARGAGMAIALALEPLEG